MKLYTKLVIFCLTANTKSIFGEYFALGEL